MLCCCDQNNIQVSWYLSEVEKESLFLFWSLTQSSVDGMGGKPRIRSCSRRVIAFNPLDGTDLGGHNGNEMGSVECRRSRDVNPFGSRKTCCGVPAPILNY